MKKLFSTVCITFCLLFSSAAIAVRADGDGHAPGYACIETTAAGCSRNGAPPQEPGEETSASNKEEALDMTLTLLELITALIP